MSSYYYVLHLDTTHENDVRLLAISRKELTIVICELPLVIILWLISWDLIVVGVTVQEDESDDEEIEEKERFLQTLFFVLSVALYAGTPHLCSVSISLKLLMMSCWISYVVTHIGG